MPTLAAPLALIPLLAQGANPDFAELDARWAGAIEAFRLPGAAVVVVERDQVLHLATFGLRDVERGLPVTPETMFYIASATKPFVAFAAAQLAERGDLELETPVAELLPRFRLADPGSARTITVEDLLCHRPGLNSFPIVWLDAYTGAITEDRFYHFLAEVEPTGATTYTNLHFTLAGRVLEAVAGEPWREVLRRQVFEPAGMTRTTGYATAMYADRDVAIPTVWTAEGFVPAPVRKTDDTMHAAGGLGLSARDAARWLTVQVDGGSIEGTSLLSERMLEETHRPRSTTGDGVGARSFALGWQVHSWNGRRWLQHGGGYVGASSRIGFLPDEGLGVAVLVHTDVGGNAFADLVTSDVFAFLLAEASPDLLPEMLREAAVRVPAPGAAPADPDALARALPRPLASYAGVYEDPWWGTLELRTDPGAGLVGALGNVALSVSAPAEPSEAAAGVEQVRLDSPGNLSELATFEVVDGRVRGVRLELQGRVLRFLR